MRILSWNVNGLAPTAAFGIYHHKSMAAWLSSLNADIVCFQVSGRRNDMCLVCRADVRVSACVRVRVLWGRVGAGEQSVKEAHTDEAAGSGAGVVLLLCVGLRACTRDTQPLPADSPAVRLAACVRTGSFCTVRSGYSGVTTYVRETGTSVAGPGVAQVAPRVVCCHSRPFGDAALDDEGRLLITDHGRFLLFNVYVPNSGGDGRPRLGFKHKFLRALAALSAWR